MSQARLVESSLLGQHPVHVAPQLLGKLLVRGARIGRIVEVEAYGGGDDPASHAHRGRTKRNSVMFERPGLLYVYFTYGMYWCANVVCGKEGESAAVLIRAIEPLEGIDLMQASRPSAKSDRDLCNGPAKLCQSFDIDSTDNGCDLVSRPQAPNARAKESLYLLDGELNSRDKVLQGPRIGIKSGCDLAWRWWIADSPYISR